MNFDIPNAQWAAVRIYLVPTKSKMEENKIKNQPPFEAELKYAVCIAYHPSWNDAPGAWIGNGILFQVCFGKFGTNLGFFFFQKSKSYNEFGFVILSN